MRTLRDVFGIRRFGTAHGAALWMKALSRGYEAPPELDGLPKAELIEALRDRPEPFFIKSHRIGDADDPAPALYLVRDGRDVHVSQAHWSRNRGWRFRDKEIAPETPFAERLDMLVRRDNWSRHVHAWCTRTSPTAIVRFEELVEDPGAIIERACDQLGVPLPERTGDLVPFSELQQRHPDVYRKGEVGSWREEMSAITEERFWEVHGEKMDLLGYSRETARA